MTDAEKLATFEELRREFRQEYDELTEYLVAVKKWLNLNFEPDRKPKGK